MKAIIIALALWVWTFIAIIFALPMFGLCSIVGLGKDYTDLQEKLADTLKHTISTMK